MKIVITAVGDETLTDYHRLRITPTV